MNCCSLYSTLKLVTDWAASFSQSNPEQSIEECWNRYVAPFAIKHGTSSLYIKHFQRHGISPTYPAPLCELVNKIRIIWADHKKTGYFRKFEERYDAAQSCGKIAVSFTADSFRTDEYTKGARGYGGELMREVRHFLSEIDESALQADDKRVIAQVRAFDDLLRKLPPMTVNIEGGSNALVRVLRHTSLLPFSDFVQKCKDECPDEKRINDYIQATVIPRLTAEISSYQSRYEITVNIPIDSKELSFELLAEKKEQDLPASDYPKLAFDTPVLLSYDECMRLRIHTYTNVSDLAEYSDSEFSVEYADGKCVVTRKRMQEETKAKVEKQIETKKLQHKMLQAFGCEELLCYL